MRKIIDALMRLFIFSDVDRRQGFANNTKFGDIGVTTNEISYPRDIECECGKKIQASPETIDTSTWNLVCTCGKIGYYHPKRHQRQRQISDMLD